MPVWPPRAVVPPPRLRAFPLTFDAVAAVAPFQAWSGPTKAGGFGDVGKVRDVFKENEIDPLIVRMLGLNEEVGVRAFSFKGST